MKTTNFETSVRLAKQKLNAARARIKQAEQTAISAKGRVRAAKSAVKLAKRKLKAVRKQSKAAKRTLANVSEAAVQIELVAVKAAKTAAKAKRQTKRSANGESGHRRGQISKLSVRTKSKRKGSPKTKRVTTVAARPPTKRGTARKAPRRSARQQIGQPSSASEAAIAPAVAAIPQAQTLDNSPSDGLV